MDMSVVRGGPSGRIATGSWELADDAWSIEPQFRDDAAFSTDRTMTADDVKFSLEQGRRPGQGLADGYLARELSSIEFTSRRTSLTGGQPWMT
jgi:ABC-type transport system substrate-binding protein